MAAMAKTVYFKLNKTTVVGDTTTTTEVSLKEYHTNDATTPIVQVNGAYYIAIDFTDNATEKSVVLTGLPVLPEGTTYTVVEAGYAKADNEFVEVDSNVGWTVTYGPTTTTEKGSEITVTNTQKGGPKLPATGSHGTTHLYTVGVLLLMAAAVTLLYRNRKCRKEDYRFF